MRVQGCVATSLVPGRTATNVKRPRRREYNSRRTRSSSTTTSSLSSTSAWRVRAESEGKGGQGEAPSSSSSRNESFVAKYESWKSSPAAALAMNDAKPFAVAEGQTAKLAGASLPLLLTAGAGAFISGYKGRPAKKPEASDGKYALPLSVGGYRWEEQPAVNAKEPEKPIEIYEFQGCPFCRKVRVAVSVLGIDVLFKPCPSGGKAWRPEAIEKGGKSQFPYMIDPNAGDLAMYESADIIEYLFKTYGPGDVPRGLRYRNSTLANGLGLIGRMGAGSRAKPSNLPEKPLDLWGYEASPFVILVKEALCELEIPYVQRTCPRGSPKRQPVFEKKGQFQVPYLEDPNTGAELFESSAIVDYLNYVYSA